MIYESRLKYVGNGFNMWKMAQICAIRLKYDGNGLDIWGNA